MISPRLYGHFAEHLGRCCYDGLFIGSQNTIAQDHGFRSDVVRALQALPVPMLRWPGGCYADHYHWRDGIGPTSERPIRLGMSCGLQVEDDNSLGTHEFLWLCAQLGAEPYLAGNVGSGTPQELCDWLEYCNTAVATTLGRMRTANGSAQPFGVKLWGVGNENWGCGGNYDAPSYAREYVRYATMLRHVDPSAELVVCGHDDDWNVKLLETVGNHQSLIDHLSIHHYWINGGPEIAFSEAEYYALLAEADEAEAFVERTSAIIQDATNGKRRIGIALDEWGVWHPEARPWGAGDVARRQPTTYEQAGTLRDALAAAVALEGFHRQCHVLTLANLAQIVNVLQAPVMTDGAHIWLTPTYYALQMHAPHIGATALPVDITNGLSLSDGSSAVSATASRTNTRLALTLINRHYDAPASVNIQYGNAPDGLSGTLLTAESPQQGNSANQPTQVSPRELAVVRDGNGMLRVDLPPHSLATIVLGD
jgi:alpha-N-arabinofuranosidase